MSVWLLGSVAMDRVGNASALNLAEGEISWPYIYMCYTHVADGYVSGFAREKGKEKQKVSLGYNTK